MTDAGSDLPTTVLKPSRRYSAAWAVPIVVAIGLLWLGYRSWSMRGVPVSVRFEKGHGLRVGDAVRFRGITIGEVTDVHLTRNLEGVLVDLAIRREGRELARRGARLWVVRPRLDLRGAEGLDTLAGSRYVAILPPDEDAAPQQHFFVGLDDPPAIQHFDPDDLEFVIESSSRGGLTIGAPVLYRQCRIGTVRSIGLAGDAGSVEIAVHVEKAYAPLIRERTRFWSAGGASAQLGLTGVSVSVESLEALLGGAIALATPPLAQAGDEVRTGHRFRLATRVDDDWLAWEPVVALGDELLPAGAARPQPQRARVGWREGRVMRTSRSRTGWIILTERGWLGPADLLTSDARSLDGTAVLEVAGTEIALDAAPLWSANGAAILDAPAASLKPWSWSRVRTAGEIEDCLLFGDLGTTPMPLTAARLRAIEGGWRVDPEIPLSRSWHGAAVVGRSDGRLIGVLLVEPDRARIALVHAD